jgi:spermidine/putrescine-binding protein
MLRSSQWAILLFIAQALTACQRPAPDNDAKLTVTPPPPPQTETTMPAFRLLAPAGHFPTWFQEKLRERVGQRVEFDTYALLTEGRQKAETNSYDLFFVSDRLVPALRNARRLGSITPLLPAPEPFFSPQFLHHYFDADNIWTRPYAWTLTALLTTKETNPPGSWADILSRRDIPGLDLPPDPSLRAALEKFRSTKTNYTPPTTTWRLGPIHELLKAKTEGEVVVLPAEGSVITLYLVAVPNEIKNPALVTRALNFLFDPETSARLANENLWNPTQPEIKKRLSSEHNNQTLLNLETSPQGKHALDRCIFVREQLLKPTFSPTSSPSASSSPTSAPVASPIPIPIPTNSR